MRKITTLLVPVSLLLAGVLTAPQLHAEGGMMQGDRGGMMGGMMQGGRGGMMGRGKEGMKSMMKQMSQMMKQMSEMMDHYSDMMGDSRPSDREKSAPSEPEKEKK